MDAIPGGHTPIDVACAIIESDNGSAVLAARRSEAMPHAGKWEFPGGKLRPGEPAAEAIVREIDEELQVGISVHLPLPPAVHNYPDKSIRLIPFVCRLTGGNPVPGEHAELRWLRPEELSGLDWLEADVQVVEAYLDWKAGAP